jgi:hypothetical protein
MQTIHFPEALLAAVNGANDVLREALCSRDLKTLVEARVEGLHLTGETADWEIRTCLTQCGREARAAYWQHFNAATTVDMYILDLSADAEFQLRRELAEYVKTETEDLEDPDHFAYDLYSVLNELD